MVSKSSTKCPPKCASHYSYACTYNPPWWLGLGLGLLGLSNSQGSYRDDDDEMSVSLVEQTGVPGGNPPCMVGCDHGVFS